MIDFSILDWLRALPHREPVTSPVLVGPGQGRAVAVTAADPAASADRVEVSDRTQQLRLESRVRDTVLAELRGLAQPDPSASDEA
jgi:hypothetical protein